jgi:hypothetical protein
MSIIDPQRIEVLDDRVAEILRGKTPAERVKMGMECTQFVRDRIRCHLHNTHPDWTKDQVDAELARRTRCS